MLHKNSPAFQRLVSIAAIVLLLTSCSRQTPNQSKQVVLFVCTHGAARSPIAAAYFNKIADEKGLNYKAVFRGTEPDESLTIETINGLKADGFEVTDMKPLPVSENDIQKANTVVTFDCDLPKFKNSQPPEQWNGTPAISKDYGLARDEIASKVNLLIDKLAAL